MRACSDANTMCRKARSPPMSHQELIDMTRSLVEHGAADTMEYADEVVRIPASSYTDPEMFEREKKQIFRRLPLMVAPSCDIASLAALLISAHCSSSEPTLAGARKV